MPSRWITLYQRHHRTLEWLLVVVGLSLFLYALADWRGWLPFERGFQPLRMVMLSAGITLQPVAALVQPRSRRLSWALLGASLAFILLSFVVGS